MLWREGKAAAVRTFARQHGIDLQQSYAYSDGYEDLPFLRAVGRARVLNPSGDLEAAARCYGWPVARFQSRSRRMVHDLVRMLAERAVRLPPWHLPAG